MARPGRPERNRAAQSFRQLRRFHHVINSDEVFGTHRAPTEAAFGLAFLLRRHTSRARCNIGRGIGHSEGDDDLPACLALKSATMFFYVLISGWAHSCHLGSWERLKPLTVSPAHQEPRPLIRPDLMARIFR